jgi:hypothetical protein
MNIFTKILGSLVIVGVVVFVYLYSVPNAGYVKNNENKEVLPIVDTPKENSPINSNNNNVACTMDAKMCPDGTYVGRTGPKCQFQACPSVKLPEQKPDTGTYNTEIGKTVLVSGIGIMPIKIKEDSRCKDGVQCFWAGRLVVTTQLTSGSTQKQIDIDMGKIVDFAGKKITLTDMSLAGDKFLFSVE